MRQQVERARWRSKSLAAWTAILILAVMSGVSTFRAKRYRRQSLEMAKQLSAMETRIDQSFDIDCYKRQGNCRSVWLDEHGKVTKTRTIIMEPSALDLFRANENLERCQGDLDSHGHRLLLPTKGVVHCRLGENVWHGAPIPWDDAIAWVRHEHGRDYHCWAELEPRAAELEPRGTATQTPFWKDFDDARGLPVDERAKLWSGDMPRAVDDP